MLEETCQVMSMASDPLVHSEKSSLRVKRVSDRAKVDMLVTYESCFDSLDFSCLLRFFDRKRRSKHVLATLKCDNLGIVLLQTLQALFDRLKLACKFLPGVGIGKAPEGGVGLDEGIK